MNYSKFCIPKARPFPSYNPRSLIDHPSGTSSTMPTTNRSPRYLKIDDVDQVKLPRELQVRLGCVVNENVFLECPYAFVLRRVVLEISQEADSPLEHLSGKIVAWEQAETLLLGYADDKILPEGQFGL